MISLRSLAPFAFALVLGLPTASHAQSFNDAQRSEIQKIIKDYLVANPELLEEMSAELQKRQAVAEAEKHRAAVMQQEVAEMAASKTGEVFDVYAAVKVRPAATATAINR